MVKADVTQVESLDRVIKRGTDAIVFAASASKEGGTAESVDNLGLVNVAKCAVAAKVRLPLHLHLLNFIRYTHSTPSPPYAQRFRDL